MKLERSIKMCVNEISSTYWTIFLNTIAAATEYGIKQTKPNQLG
jgi:hypothetical protein